MNEGIIQMYAAENSSFLAGIHQWGIEVIKIIQRIENPALTILLKFITVLGTEILYVPLILFIFWWIDEKQGLRFGILILFCAWLNSFAKNIFKHPRPYNLEPAVGLASESSYGMPSGHAQQSITFWIPMAAWLSEIWTKKRRLIWAGIIFFVLLIGFTRLYLGVHFPTDLFAGWFLGGIIIAVWFIFRPRIEKKLASLEPRVQNIIAAIAALLMTGVFHKDRTYPALFLGFTLGYILMKSRFPFSARGEVRGKKPGAPVMILRCLTGLGGMAIIYLALKFILPGEGSLFGNIPIWGEASPLREPGRFIRYCLVGFWASAGAPRLFQRMGLASAEAPKKSKDPDTSAKTET